MSLGIVIPLKSKRVSDNWNLTSKLLDETLTSLRNQSLQNFKVIIVCHELPDISAENKNIAQFLQCDFELRSHKPGQEITHYKQIDYILDKNRKISYGLEAIQSRDIEYFMVLDADDLVHKDFVKYIMDTKDPNGYIVHLGYQYYTDLEKVVDRNDIDKICGSSTVLHESLVPIPSKITDESMTIIPWCFLCHSHMETHYSETKRLLHEIPFPSVLYKLGHGQNASDEFREGLLDYIKLKAKLLIKGKKATVEIKSSFGI
ncbi:MAG TPA: glycosyltransferase family A protein [Cytophagaceae bacterium]|jgi:glycosyltransferase involved in cell wall biosynthesis